MAVPPIEMRWGGGRWPSGPKRRLRPFIETCLGLTEDGLEHLNIHPASSKLATIWGVHNSFDRVGEAIDDENFRLFIREEFIKRPRKLHNPILQAIYSLKSLHEVVHCVRDEKGFHIGMTERAVGEGISSWAEYLTAKALLTEGEFEALKPMFSLNAEDVDRSSLFEAFWQDSTYEAALSETDPTSNEIEELHAAWFYADGIPAGARVGFLAVGDLIKVGADLSELVHLPAEDIFAIAL